MKLVVTSDLHLGITTEKELSRFVSKIAKLEPDLFVAAGDLGEFGGYFTKCLEILSKIPAKQHAALVGNHDLWTRNPEIATSKQLWEDIWPGVMQELGWVWLEDTVVKLGRTAVIGSIAWYDYSAASNIPEDLCRIMKGHYNNDGNYMDKSWNDVEFAAARRYGLVTNATHLDDDEGIDDTIVITHVPIFEAQHIRSRYDQPAADAYFYNYTLGKCLLNIKKLRTVISGHTHRGMDEIIHRDGSDVRVMVVPSEYHKPGFVELEFCDTKE